MDRQLESSSRPQVIDTITVVFARELPLLEIQARSFELYTESHRLNNIYVIVNDEDSVADQILPEWYGVNAHKVKIIPRSHWGHTAHLDGWSSQQLYKLLAAEQAASTWSMCMDAKTWFVQPLVWDKLFDADGRVNFKSGPIDNYFESARLFCQDYFNIEFNEVAGPGGVPFIFHTKTVQKLFRFVEKRSHTNFYDFFVKHVQLPDDLTEFVLYSAFVIYSYGHINYLYSQQQFYGVCNMADREVPNFNLFHNRIKHNSTLTASIQGRAYPYLSDEQLDTWLEFLLSAQLITDKEITKSKLNILK